MAMSSVGELRRYMYVADLVALPAERGKGYGKALFAWLEDEARREGCKRSAQVPLRHHNLSQPTQPVLRRACKECCSCANLKLDHTHVQVVA